MTGFLSKVKDELAHYQASRHCCQLAELSALLHLDGAVKLRGGGRQMLLTDSPHASTARKIYTLLHSLFDVETPVLTVERSSPRHMTTYMIEVPEQPGFHQLMNELGVLDSSLAPENSVPRRLTRNDCCAAAALRGAFLGGGFVSGPYGPADFEISFSSREGAMCFMELFSRKSLPVMLRERGGQWVLYMKKRQQISEFLAVTGAHSAHLEWESQTILNATRNDVNRLVNCDTANARRLARASSRQCELVKQLLEQGALEVAEPSLRELAEARLANPQASLGELGRALDPPVGKSTVQGRMRRLEALKERP